jgi:hypothetical protein
MCTYQTARLPVEGSAKGPNGWFALTDATVYFDHPVSAPYDHSLNIDFFSFAQHTPGRVAVELDPNCARELAIAIFAVLGAAPPALIGEAAVRSPSAKPT